LSVSILYTKINQTGVKFRKILEEIIRELGFKKYMWALQV